jgi:hypothetical protein
MDQRGDVYSTDDGQMIVCSLYKKVPRLSLRLKVALKELHKNPKWRDTKDNFAKGREELFKFIDEQDYIPQGDNWS